MFRVEYAIHIRYRSGWSTFRREDMLPFAPFLGLDVLDDMVGQFTLTSVAWHRESEMFLCQSKLEYKDRTIRQVAALFRKSHWEEDKDARMPAEPDE